ncbi:MAG: lysylphosphatidylglycerol synthase transmembrane domain-containing protein [Candidatus Moraniibacteriota bacterium]
MTKKMSAQGGSALGGTKKIAKFTLKLLVSLGLLAWVIFKVEWAQTWVYLQRVQIWQIVLYLSLVIFGMLISSWKWQLLSKFKGIHRPFFDHFKFYLTGAFVNNFMPSFIGGDTYRAFQLGKPEKKYTQAASTVVIDRVTGLIAATILAVVFSLLNLETVLKSNLLIFMNLAIIGSLAFDLVLMRMKKIAYLQKLAAKYLPEKILHFLRELEAYSHDHGVLWQAIGWGCVFTFLGMAMSNYVLMLALGVHIGLLDYLSVIFLITIVSSIPITINNIGLKEWAYVTFFGLFGVNSSLIIIVAILGRFFQMALSFTALPMYLKTKKDIPVEN